MIDYRDIIKNREFRLKLIDKLKFIPTKPYIKMVYRIKTGKKLNLENPVTLCDKLNWLKINDIHPEYTRMVDKVALHDVIKEKLGEDICIPMLGAWEHYSDIDFDKLPDKFVLKCNHDSGSVKIITDKSKINHDELNKFFEARLKMNPYNIGREYPYKDVKPMIMAEEYMVPEDKSDIDDYKFFCFNGKPEVCLVVTGRAKDCRNDIFDMDFNLLDIDRVHPHSDVPIEKPETFDEMKELAAKLSKGIKMVRIDLYEINGKVYFGEFTFFPAGGFHLMKPDKWEKYFGDLIDLK